MSRDVIDKLLLFWNNPNERTRELNRNLFFSIVLKGLSIIISFLIVPITIDYVNPVQYGIWLTISSLIAWFFFFDIGLSNGFRNRFAANNTHKLEEVRAIAGDKLIIKSLSDIGCHDDIPETADSLEGNALIKARWIRDKYGFDCFADDTGLMVDALDGAPGVLSARYAGEECIADNNINLLLKNLEGEKNRKAHFSTVIALCLNNEEYIFHGCVNGQISHSRHGEEGFGYDPIFIADETGLAFAEMSQEDKNKISHRGRAMQALFKFLFE